MTHELFTNIGSVISEAEEGQMQASQTFRLFALFFRTFVAGSQVVSQITGFYQTMLIGIGDSFQPTVHP
jgi:hypothetical protein